MNEAILLRRSDTERASQGTISRHRFLNPSRQNFLSLSIAAVNMAEIHTYHGGEIFLIDVEYTSCVCVFYHVWIFLTLIFSRVEKKKLNKNRKTKTMKTVYFREKWRAQFFLTKAMDMAFIWHQRRASNLLGALLKIHPRKMLACWRVIAFWGYV